MISRRRVGAAYRSGPVHPRIPSVGAVAGVLGMRSPSGCSSTGNDRITPAAAPKIGNAGSNPVASSIVLSAKEVRAIRRPCKLSRISDLIHKYGGKTE